MQQRSVTVQFHKGGRLIEEWYGPFLTGQQIGDWFDKHDEEQTFTKHDPIPVFIVRKIAEPDVPAVASRARSARTRKKATA